MRYRGFSKENIHYLSPDPDQDVDGNGMFDDIDGAATLAQAEEAFTNTVAHADRPLRLLGRSRRERLRQRLLPPQRHGNHHRRAARHVAGQLPERRPYRRHRPARLLLRGQLPERALLHRHRHAHRDRRLRHQPAQLLWRAGWVSFSGAFFSGVMLGYDVMQCFAMAQSAMATYQHALLDDDKNGAYTTNDWGRATGTTIGPSSLAAGNAPQIGEVRGNQVLTEETAATLWIGSVTPRPVARLVPDHPAGAHPRPRHPRHRPPAARPGLQRGGRYAVTYDGFTVAGTYNITFYVQDEEGKRLQPAHLLYRAGRARRPRDPRGRRQHQRRRPGQRSTI